MPVEAERAKSAMLLLFHPVAHDEEPDQIAVGQ
jgi:hypothetical protein